MGSSKEASGRLWPRAPFAALAALWAAALGASPVAAQDTGTATPRAQIVQSLSLDSAQDMDFGKIAYTGAGTVVLSPTDPATCTPSALLNQYGACTPAVFVGFGEANRTVRIKLPPSGRIDLTGPAGATMRISEVTMDAGSTLTVAGSGNGFRRYQIASADGSFEFRVGGTLNVAAGQAFGLYTGTFNIEIAYE